MTAIQVAPFVLKDVELTLTLDGAGAGDEYSAHVSTVLFSPSTSTIEWKGLSPAARFTRTTDPTWTVQLDFAQDWETADSLSDLLLANVGVQAAARFMPRKSTAPGKPYFTATLNLTPGPIGGTVDSVATGSVTLGLDGPPVKALIA